MYAGDVSLLICLIVTPRRSFLLPAQANLSTLIARLKPGAVAAAAANLAIEASGGGGGRSHMRSGGLMVGAARVVKPGDW